MRHTVLACAVVLVACTRADKPADTTAAAATPPAPPAITLADLAGTWDIKSMPVGRDTIVATSVMTATATMEGWSMKLGGSNEVIPVKVVSVAGDSVVTEAGPFTSVLRKGQKVSIHSIQHVQGGRMTGVNHAKYSNGDTATLRLEGTKRP